MIWIRIRVVWIIKDLWIEPLTSVLVLIDQKRFVFALDKISDLEDKLLDGKEMRDFIATISKDLNMSSIAQKRCNFLSSILSKWECITLPIFISIQWLREYDEIFQIKSASAMNSITGSSDRTWCSQIVLSSLDHQATKTRHSKIWIYCGEAGRGKKGSDMIQKPLWNLTSQDANDHAQYVYNIIQFCEYIRWTWWWEPLDNVPGIHFVLAKAAALLFCHLFQLIYTKMPEILLDFYCFRIIHPLNIGLSDQGKCYYIWHIETKENIIFSNETMY